MKQYLSTMLIVLVRTLQYSICPSYGCSNDLRTLSALTNTCVQLGRALYIYTCPGVGVHVGVACSSDIRLQMINIL